MKYLLNKRMNQDLNVYNEFEQCISKHEKSTKSAFLDNTNNHLVALRCTQEAVGKETIVSNLTCVKLCKNKPV